MLTADDRQLIAQIAALAEKTGAAILSFYNTPNSYHIVNKSNHTPLTEADLVAHNILAEGLPRILPLPCLSEESDSVVHHHPPDDYWLIDPIDGTQEFINKTGEFCILIARIYQKRPILSFIYAPVNHQYWFALWQKGAYFSNQQNTVRLFCRKANPQALTIITARPQLSQRARLYFRQNFPGYHITHRGSALKFCALAEGQADIYPKLSRTTSQWDVAAGDLLLQEAGGLLRFYGNQLPLYGSRETLNPPFLALGAGFSETVITRYFSSMEAILHGKY